MNKNKFSLIKSYRFSFILGIGLSCVTLIIYQILLQQNHQQIQKKIQKDTAQIQKDIVQKLDHQVLALVSSTQEGKLDDVNLATIADQQALIKQFSGYDQIQKIDQDGNIVMQIVKEKNQDLLLNLHNDLTDEAINLIKEAQKKQDFILKSGLNFTAKKQNNYFSIYIPILEQKPSSSKGAVIGVFNIQDFFHEQQKIYQERGYDLKILNDNNLNENEQKSQTSLNLLDPIIIDIYNLRWWAKIEPKPTLIAQYQSKILPLILSVSLLISWGIVGLLIFLKWQDSRRNMNEQESSAIKGYEELTKLLNEIDQEQETKAKIEPKIEPESHPQINIVEEENLLSQEHDQLIQELKFQKYVLDQSAIVATTDAQGIITYVNEQFCKVSQYTQSELIGKTHSIIKSDEHSPEFFQHLWATISQGKIWRGEIKNKAKDGSCYWVSTTIVPFLDEQGKPIQYTAIRYNITPLKNTQLALEKAKLNAQKANQIKTEFLGIISHELRTPMNGIIGMTELLLDTNLTEKQQEFIKTIGSCSHNLLTIINEILDYTHLESGQVLLQESPFSLRNCVETTLELMSEKAQAKKLKLDYFITPETPDFIQADRRYLEQVLLYILDNAVKFTEEGEIIVAISSELENEHIYQIRFSVKDTGIGIAPEDQEKLFKPFSQIDGSTTRKYVGIGLGLAISKLICELMGGEIWVESQENIGSTFYFTLVALEVQNYQIPADNLIQDYPSFEVVPEVNSLKILLAEDNNTSKKIILLILKKLGYQADVVMSGLEVLEALSQQNYDVILMDLEISDLDNFKTTQQILYRSLSPSRPYIIVISSNQLEYDQQKLLTLGIDDYLMKPIHLENLQQALAKVKRLN